MKKLTLFSLAFFICLGMAAKAPKSPFPKSQKEDKGNKVMSQAYWDIWNPEVQARIDADIDANRKADAVLNLTGLPSGTRVKIEQISSDFVFGAHIFNFNQLGTHERNERYKALYGTLFNSATIGFYWRDFEPVPGKLRFKTEYEDTEEFWNNCQDPKRQPHWRRPSTDQVVEFCESKGIRLHGHPLIWGSRRWHYPWWMRDSLATPKEEAILKTFIGWKKDRKTKKPTEKYTPLYKSLTAAQVSDSLPEFAKTMTELHDKRIREIAAHYQGRIHSWDVANESASDFKRMKSGSPLMKSSYGIMPADYTWKAFQTAASVFPENVKLNINEESLGSNYHSQVKDLLKRGCKVDIMGAQQHLFKHQQCLDIAEGKDLRTPAKTMAWYNKIRVEGVPIHISEVTISAPGDDERGRQIQAVIARNLYRIWFSLPQAMGITWWNVVDDCGAPGEPDTSGLFDRDMNPKPSYFAVSELINKEWRTNLTVKLKKDKTVRFRGFKGKYRMTWTAKDGSTVTKEFHLSGNGDGITL